MKKPMRRLRARKKKKRKVHDENLADGDKRMSMSETSLRIIERGMQPCLILPARSDLESVLNAQYLQLDLGWNFPRALLDRNLLQLTKG